MELNFFGMAVGLLFLTGAVISLVNQKLGDLIPPKIGVVKWLGQSYHWHDFGHFMVDYAITTFTAFSFVAAMALAFNIKTQFMVEVIGLNLLRFLVNHPVGLAFLFAVPSTLLTLYIEIVNDGHWRAFIGKDVNWKDFLFDLFTHIAGGVTASLFLAGLAITIQKTVPLFIVLRMAGIL